MWIAPLVAAFASSAAFAQEANVPADVRREWTLRDWALFPDDHAAQFEAARRSEDWRERYMVVEALGRSYAGARWVERYDSTILAGLLGDEHPNVRAAALGLIEHLEDAPKAARLRLLELARATVREPLAEVAPAVREALARALGQAPCLRPPSGTQADTDVAMDALLALARADGGRSGRVAARELATLGPEADAALSALLAAEFDARGVAAWVEALPLMIRAVHGPGVVASLRAKAAGGTAGVRSLPEAFALHMEVRDAPDAPRAEREVLAAGWLARRDDPRRRGLLIEVARLADAELGEALMRMALTREANGLGADDEGTTFLVECAAMALEAGAAAERALALGPDLAALVWAELATRRHRWDADAVRPWLAEAIPADLREQVVSVTAGSAAEVSADADRILLETLRDPDPGLRASAFRWLARRRGSEDYLEEQFAAWDKLAPDAQLELLRDLPRTAPPAPFRAVLLELGGQVETRTASVLELLATFSADEEIGAALARWFESEVSALERQPTAGAFRAHELGAAELARALRGVLGEGAAPALDDALSRTLPLEHAPRSGGEPALRPVLPKALAGELAQMEEGRARLPRYLEPETPRRLRIEAALGLLGTPVVHRRAAELLRADYGGCDTILRQRILKALVRAVDPVNVEFLEGVARDGRAPLEQRIIAVEALAARPADEALGRILLEVPDVEVRLAVIASGRGTQAFAPRLRAAREGRWIESETSVREVLALEASMSRRLDPEILSDLLRRPLAGAARDLAGRFGGPGGASAAARWAPELALARSLASAMPDTLTETLARCGPWWRLEPELLGLLAEAARGAAGGWGLGHENPGFAVAERLCQAALVALEGEVPGEGTDGNRLRLYLMAMDLAQAPTVKRRAQEREDGRALAYWADRAQHFARIRPGTFRALETQMGGVDRRAGVDPWARLASVREQARVWAAGHRSEREFHLERARVRVGFSRAAREAQAEVERF